MFMISDSVTDLVIFYQIICCAKVDYHGFIAGPTLNNSKKRN